MLLHHLTPYTLHLTPSVLTVHAPAKLNLFFEVYGRRPDGFHDIASVALPVSVYDTLELEVTDGPAIEFACQGGSNDIPVDDTNIVVKALRLFQTRTQTRQGIRCKLHKRIPSQAGLGGGSSDAVAALKGAGKLWQFDLSEEQLNTIVAETAAEIGSDCPLFLRPSASLSRGRGENVVPVPVGAELHFVVYKPPQGLSTAEVYRRVMSLHDGNFRQPEPFLDALADGHLSQIAQFIFNRLEVPAREIWPEFETAKRELSRLDCLAVQMSGSGTAFFGLCENAHHAEYAADQLRGRVGNEAGVYAIHPD